MTVPSLLDEWDVDVPSGGEPAKTYVGRRWPRAHVLERGVPEVTVLDGGKERPLKSLGRHSPDGYEWGYNGSGPTELALAILADHLGYEPPVDLYVAYRRAVVARLADEGWAIGSPDVRAWLSTHLTRGRP